MYILAINLSHHASICLLQDEKIIFYLEYDRLSGEKEGPFKSGDWQQVKLLDVISNYTKHIDHLIFCSFGKDKIHSYSDEELVSFFKNALGELQITFDNSHFYNEHHLYHATNAFYHSKFDEAAVLILDGGGTYYDGLIPLRESESMYYFSNLEFETIKKHYSRLYIFSDSNPIKYNQKTIFSTSLSCGWIFNYLIHLSKKSAGHIMCISSYGDLEKVPSNDWFLYDKNSDIWYTDNNTILEIFRENCNMSDIKPYDINPHNNIGNFLIDYNSEFCYQALANVAKKAQKETKEHTIRLIQQLLEKCNTKNVVLSGGYMLNCVNNYEYLKAFPDINFYIDPIAHDGGTAIGAAKYLWHNVLKNSKRGKLETLYLG